MGVNTCTLESMVSYHYPPRTKDKTRVSHNALFRNSQTHSVNESIYDFDRVFLGIPVKNWIVGMLSTCPIGISYNDCFAMRFEVNIDRVPDSSTRKSNPTDYQDCQWSWNSINLVITACHSWDMAYFCLCDWRKEQFCIYFTQWIFAVHLKLLPSKNTFPYTPTLERMWMLHQHFDSTVLVKIFLAYVSIIFNQIPNVNYWHI